MSTGGLHVVFRSLFNMEFQEHLRTGTYPEKHPAEHFADVAIETIEDDAVRREVFEVVQETLDEVSMVEVHGVLDALVKILKGENQ